MSTFIHKMDETCLHTNANVRGLNGAWQKPLPHAEDLDVLTSLFVEACRGADGARLGDKLASVLSSSDPNAVHLAIVMVFQLRDIRGGKGERQLYLDLFDKVCSMYQKTACRLIRLVPEYGRYKDLVDMWTRTSDERLKDELVAVYANALLADQKTLGCRESGGVVDCASRLTFAAKWLPGSKRSTNHNPTPAHEFRRAVRDKVFGSDPYASQKLRKLVSACNKGLRVAETLMSTGRWADIDPSSLTSGALHKYRLALLYEPTRGEALLRGTDPDRTALRERVLAARPRWYA